MAVLTVRLTNYDAAILSAVSKQTGQSKSALVQEGLRYIFSQKLLDDRLIHLSQADYQAALHTIQTPVTDSQVLAVREKLLATKPVWED